jgi:hypothetical protein
MAQPLDYSGPYTNAETRISTSRSILVGVISWCTIFLAIGLFYLAEGQQQASITVPFAAAIFLLIFETALAFYGLLCAAIDCHLIRPVWRGIVGLALNLTALWPVLVIIILSAR